MNQPQLEIRRIRAGDAVWLARTFQAIGWESKSEELFECYRSEQDRGEREVFLVFAEGEFAGYITVKWTPTYKPLVVNRTPELQDLNVLPSFRRRGIGTRLIAAAEDTVRIRSDRVGIAVGLHPGYNRAQRLYAVLGYVPDGNGITVAERPVHEGQSVVVDDDLVLHLEKVFDAADAG